MSSEDDPLGLFTGPAITEPAAFQREFAHAMAGQYVAFVQAGFDTSQSMYLVGQIVAGIAGRTPDSS